MFILRRENAQSGDGFNKRVTHIGKLRGKSGKEGRNRVKKSLGRVGHMKVCEFYPEVWEIPRGFHVGRPLSSSYFRQVTGDSVQTRPKAVQVHNLEEKE